jgi:hypothetical protein
MAEEMIRDLNVQAGSEMVRMLKAAKPAKPKVRKAGVVS